MPTTDDDEFVYPRWSMGPPIVPTWLSDALWEAFAEQYSAAAAEFERGMLRLIGPQCAPAIGVHQGCEHDEEASGELG